jgi:predicted transcriptional regulator YheO
MEFSAYHLTLIIVALISGVLSPISLQIAQYLFKKKRESKKTSLDHNNAIKTEDLITSKLEHIKGKFHCDRVWVAEFHNGGKTYSGKSFQKFSETYEVVAQGVAAEAIHTQNIPTSIFSALFKTLNENHYYLALNTKKSEDTVSFIMQSFWENRGICSFAAIAIKDIQNNFVGILCLDGVIRPLKIQDMDVQKLIVYASNLAGYLEQ